MPNQEPAANNLDALLHPISAESPGGAALRYDRVYDLIREARREDDPSLPQGEWGHKLKVADFAQVERLCTEALTTRSKDLRVAAWLTEAWARTRGILGATRGLYLFGELIERYWDVAFPSLDEEEGSEARVGLVDWLDELLAAAVRRTPIGNDAAPVLTYEDWERAERGMAGVSDGSDGQPSTPESLMARYSLIGVARWRAVHDMATAALNAAADMHEKMVAKTTHAPVMRRLRDVLMGLIRISEEITGDDPASAAVSSPPEALTDAPISSVEGSMALGPIKNRAEAYMRLTQAADYLLRTEPHSPVPYLVKRAVGWGNMSLAELLMELVGTPDDLVAIQRLLGMRGKE